MKKNIILAVIIIFCCSVMSFATTNPKNEQRVSKPFMIIQAETAPLSEYDMKCEQDVKKRIPFNGTGVIGFAPYAGGNSFLQYWGLGTGRICPVCGGELLFDRRK